MPDLVALLRAADVANVADRRVAPRPGSHAPVGIIVHHTGMKTPGLATCQKGRPDLPGPLCQINITRAGTVNVVTDGRANHGGEGSSVVLADVKANRPVTKDARERKLHDDGCDGNRWYIGIEVDNDGVGEPYGEETMRRLVGVCAAICQHFGWPPQRVIHHRQHTARKVDMSFRGPLTKLVADRMAQMAKAA